MYEPFRLLILGSALLAAILVLRQHRTIRARWDTSATAIFGIAWILNSTHLIAAATGNFGFRIDPLSGAIEIVYGELPGTIHKYGLAAIAVVGGALVAHYLVNRRPWNPAGFVALLTIGLVLLSTWGNGLGINRTSACVMLVVGGLAMLLRPGPGARLGAAMFGVTLVMASAVMLQLAPLAAARTCGAKCGPLGVLYTGAFANENAFGLSLVAALPFVLTSFRGRTRLVLVAAMGVAALGADSRTSQFAMALTVLVFAVAAAARRIDPSAARGLMNFSVLITTGAALVVPLLLGDVHSSNFTTRARLWGLAVQGWQESWLIGKGGPAWSNLRASGLIGAEAAYSPHNQWLEVLFAGGLLAAGTFAVFVVTLYRSSRLEDRLAVGVVIVAVMTAGVLERIWSFTTPDWLFWSVLAACLAGRRRERQPRTSPYASARQASPMVMTSEDFPAT